MGFDEEISRPTGWPWAIFETHTLKYLNHMLLLCMHLNACVIEAMVNGGALSQRKMRRRGELWNEPKKDSFLCGRHKVECPRRFILGDPAICEGR